MARRFLLVVLLACGAILGTLLLFNVLAHRQGWTTWHFAYLFRYQTEKIDGLRDLDIDVVFLGDSSLGNSISASHLTRVHGLTAANLALTGAYGFAGDLNMLRRVLRRMKPRLVVLMHTPHALERPASHRGLVFSAEEFADLAEAPAVAIVGAFLDIGTPLNVLAGTFARSARHNSRIQDDYVQQGARIDPPGPEGERGRAQVDPSNLRYLSALGQLCQDQGLRCIYLHGPYASPACEEKIERLQAIDAAIREAGLLPAGGPLCIPPRDLGDAPDHVAPEAKVRFTDAYLRLLREVPQKALALPQGPQ